MRTGTKTRAGTRLAYIERVNLAIDDIVAHLEEPLRLERVARAAKMSPFHFHRVFQVLVGETIADFVKRLRLERALFMLAHGREKSLTRIALACGFTSSSDFSRCFKQRYGTAARAFDIDGWRRKQGSKLAAAGAEALHLKHEPRGGGTRNPDGFAVKIRALPARTVAYIRVRDPYKPGAVLKATERLMAWAERRGVADRQWLGYQWDNPEIASLEDCQYHIAVEAEDFAARGEIGRYRFPPMVVAEVEIRGGIDLELRALHWIFGTWLPGSGYEPDDQPCFEAFIGRPFAHGTAHFELKAQLPVRRG